jgi:hypothetical protein
LSPGQSFRVFFTSNWKRKSQTRECSTTYMSREKTHVNLFSRTCSRLRRHENRALSTSYVIGCDAGARVYACHSCFLRTYACVR